jgi:excisionase family DNA binding protein
MTGERTVGIGIAAETLGISVDTMRRWADAGQVPTWRTPGGRRRFRPDDLAALMGGDMIASTNPRTLDQLPELVTRAELAEFTGFSVSALAHWAGEGIGPKPTRIGRAVRYRKRDVTAWLDALGRSPR